MQWREVVCRDGELNMTYLALSLSHYVNGVAKKHEAFQQKDWQVDETSQVLRAMRAIEDLIIVGVYSNERREEEYTKPGYEAYARSVVKELVRAEQVFLRTTKDAKDRTMADELRRRMPR